MALRPAFLLLAALTSCTRGSRTPVLDAAAPVELAEPSETRERREELVRWIEVGGVKSRPVLDALRKVPRHLYAPDATLTDAYGDWPLPIGSGQTISQPSLVAVMTEALGVEPRHKVLEIGTGSGYQAAVLSLLARDVYTIEILPELGEVARARLSRLGHRNVHVRIGDGYAGWPEHAPFDRIIVTAAPPELPKALTDQLADGGVLVAPIGDERRGQWLVRVKKIGGELASERLEPVRFVPMVRGR